MNTTGTNKLSEYTVPQKGKLEISNDLLTHIHALHRAIGDIEWCGVLLFSEKSGTIQDPSNLVLRAEDLYLMDIGSEAYTEATMGDQIVDIYERFPKADPSITKKGRWRTGLIHTHHSMRTFFSGTDMSELRDNTPNHVYYLSLIVNHANKFTAKVAYIGECIEKKESIITIPGLKRRKSVKSVTSEEKKVMYIIDLDVVFPPVEKWFGERYSEVKKEKEEAKKRVVSHTTYSGYEGFGEHGGFGRRNFYPEQKPLGFGVGSAPTKKKENPIKETVEEEDNQWKRFFMSWLLSTTYSCPTFPSIEPNSLKETFNTLDELIEGELLIGYHTSYVIANLHRVYKTWFGHFPGARVYHFGTLMEDVRDYLEEEGKKSEYMKTLLASLTAYLNSEVIYDIKTGEVNEKVS